MSYQAEWDNGSGGRLTGGQDWLRPSDAEEMLAAVNRRRLLTFQDALAAALLPSATPLGMLRASLASDILQPPVGVLGGDPVSPAAMVWLWPEADGDEGKAIVGGAPGQGQVGLFDRLNGGAGWTDASVVGGHVRAAHWNELRQAAEWIRRGRWRLPLYLTGGLNSIVPDLAWFGGAVGRNGLGELRTCGFAWCTGISSSGEATGLRDIDVLNASRIEVTADCDCELGVSRCMRAIDFVNDPPTWNQYAPASGGDWETPGGWGNGDAESIGTIQALSGQAAVLTGAAVAAAFQAVVDGAQPNFAFRRLDDGPETVSLMAWLEVEFELRSPPN